MSTLIKIGGSLLDDPAARASLAAQIAPLQNTVVVHGGGKQMTRYLDAQGIESRFVNGLRVTTRDTVDAVLKVFAGTVNTELVAALGAAGARAVGLTGVDAGLARASQLNAELGFVGRVDSSDATVLHVLVGAGFLPVVACMAGSPSGQIYNVNADSMAVACAGAWQAGRLIFLTDVEGVLDAEKRLIPELSMQQCLELIHSGVATGGMEAKLNSAVDAVCNGVAEVSIVKGSEPGVVGRVLAGERIGTSISLLGSAE